MEEIKQELVDLGFKKASNGIVYWADAIKYIRSKDKIIPIMEIYGIISKKRGKPVSSIERAMRYSIIPAKPYIQEKYNYYGKISNMDFVKLIKFGEVKMNPVISRKYVEKNYIKKLDLESFINTELIMIKKSREVKGFLTTEQCDAMEAVYNTIKNLFLGEVQEKAND